VYLREAAGLPRRIDCGELTIYVGNVFRGCSPYLRDITRGVSSCTATVSDAEACAEDYRPLTDEQWCSGTEPDSCMALLGAECRDHISSGVPESKSLASLSNDEAEELCWYLVKTSGPERTARCDDEEVTVSAGGGTIEECFDGIVAIRVWTPGCAVTVGDAEACARGRAALTDEQLCVDPTPFPEACEVRFGAGCGG
jgi:hypothetical protein